MPIVFAAAASHAPGLTAWPDAASKPQNDALRRGFEVIRTNLEAARPEALILLTSEHWTNFFLDHIGAFCVGRAEFYEGPVEPWLNVPKTRIPGDASLAAEIVTAAYAADVEPSFAYEMVFDHGSMLPLHFMAPSMAVPVVPILFNTLAEPQPTAARCARFGSIIGDVARRSGKRIAVLAAGGMSHDPGERAHGRIDSDFDRIFLDRICAGDTAALSRYAAGDFAAAGAGAYELLAWIALSAAIGGRKGEMLAYEAVVPWATGMGIVQFPAAA